MSAKYHMIIGAGFGARIRLSETNDVVFIHLQPISKHAQVEGHQAKAQGHSQIIQDQAQDDAQDKA